jgi:hypothetical protein
MPRLARVDVTFRRGRTVLPAEKILAVVCRRLAVDRERLLRRRRKSLDRAVASRMLCDLGGSMASNLHYIEDIPFIPGKMAVRHREHSIT